MGWTFGYRSMREMKADLLRERSDGYKLLDSASTNYGRNLWVVYQHPNGEKFIGLYLCNRRDGQYGYKDITESMGPCEVDCPLRMLDIVPTPNSEYAQNWRNEVRAHHAKRSVTFSIGSEVKIYGKPYKVIGTVKRSYRVQSLETGAVYKCGASKMVAA